jgi:hypothetical protein
MIRDSRGNVRLTKSEHNKLRQENAKNGVVIGNIKTDGDLLDAAICGLPNEIVDDMLQFFETGSSPLTRKGTVERKREDDSDSAPDNNRY